MMKATAVAMLALTALAAEAHAACPPAQVGGNAGCPEFTAPAATAVPGPSIDGSTSTFGGLGAPPTVLFGGITPPNGFMIQAYALAGKCVINDAGPVNGVNGPSGFILLAGDRNASPGSGSLRPGDPYPTFVTPPGYKPMGPVLIVCEFNTALEARAW
jgi:hypothetical protein